MTDGEAHDVEVFFSRIHRECTVSAMVDAAAPIGGLALEVRQEDVDQANRQRYLEVLIEMLEREAIGSSQSSPIRNLFFPT